MKNVTRKDIAEKLGVSVSVVSRVINNSGYVSKEKREKVLKAAKEMGYVQNPVAMALQQNKTKQLLFFCEDLTSTYYNQMYHGMVRAAKERGYHVLTVMDENDFEILRTILSKVKHPVIAEGNINTPAKLKRVLELGAFCAVVGSAITRPQLITKSFANAIK